MNLTQLWTKILSAVFHLLLHAVSHRSDRNASRSDEDKSKQQEDSKLGGK